MNNDNEMYYSDRMKKYLAYYLLQSKEKQEEIKKVIHLILYKSKEIKEIEELEKERLKENNDKERIFVKKMIHKELIQIHKELSDIQN